VKESKYMIKLKVSNLDYNSTTYTGSNHSQYRVKDDMQVSFNVDLLHNPYSKDNILDGRKFWLKGDIDLCYIKYGVVTDYTWERKVNYEYGDLLVTIQCKHEPRIAESKKDLLKEMI